MTAASEAKVLRLLEVRERLGAKKPIHRGRRRAPVRWSAASPGRAAQVKSAIAGRRFESTPPHARLELARSGRDVSIARVRRRR